MSLLKRFTSWVCLIGALVLVAWPADADAQRRRGSRRVIRPAVRTSVWYGPGFGFYNPYVYGPSPFGPWGPYAYYGARYEERGSIRLQVKPEETEVYVDGYYAGVVDSYDGFFQRLHLPAQPDADASRSPRPEPGGRRAAPLPRAQVSGFGTLLIRVQPDDAMILVDGEEWRSPDTARLELELGAGRHHIEVRHAGYEGYATDVEVRPGETTAVNISLPRGEEGR